jgi:hypothetical protein
MSISSRLESELELCAQELYVYDVIQGGWVHEQRGLEVNVGHVLTHLTKGYLSKNFMDSDEVRTAIAPDSAQYALRLARWTGHPAAELAGPTSDDKINAVANNLGFVLRTSPIGLMVATGLVGDSLHTMGHASDIEAVRDEIDEPLMEAGRFLARYAIKSAVYYGNDFKESFDARLAEIRQVSDIDNPTAEEAAQKLEDYQFAA